MASHDVQALFHQGGLDSKRRASISAANIDQFLESVESTGPGTGSNSSRRSRSTAHGSGNRKPAKTPPGGSRLRERIKSYNELPIPDKKNGLSSRGLPSLDQEGTLLGPRGADADDDGFGPSSVPNPNKIERNTISGENAEDFAAELHRARRDSHHAMLGGRPGGPDQNDFGGPRVHRREHQVGMIRDLKIQRAREARKTLEEEESARVLGLIEARDAATARVAYLRDPQVQARQSQFMSALVAVRFAENIWAASRGRRISAPEDKKRRMAAAVIQRMHKSRKNVQMWQLAVKFVVRVHKCKPRLSLAVRCWRRYRAADRLRAFLADHLSDAVKLKVLLYKFIRRVRQCQRAIRDFIACRDARLAVLRKVWDSQQAIYLKFLEKNKGEESKNASSPGSGGGPTTPAKKMGFGQNPHAKRRGSVSKGSQSSSSLLNDAISSLKEIREDAAIPKVPKATRDACLATLLQKQRKTFLKGEQQAASMRSPDSRMLGTRKNSVAKVGAGSCGVAVALGEACVGGGRPPLARSLARSLAHSRPPCRIRRRCSTPRTCTPCSSPTTPSRGWTTSWTRSRRRRSSSSSVASERRRAPTSAP